VAEGLGLADGDGALALALGLAGPLRDAAAASGFSFSFSLGSCLEPNFEGVPTCRLDFLDLWREDTSALEGGGEDAEAGWGGA